MMRAGLLAMVLLSTAAFPAAANAAATVREISIAEGETFEFSPFAMEVRFSEPVHLVTARLIDQEGRETPLDLSFYRNRASTFVIELPVLLPHGYRLSWGVRGATGAQTRGSVGFVVKGCLDPRAVKPFVSPAAGSRQQTSR